MREYTPFTPLELLREELVPIVEHMQLWRTATGVEALCIMATPGRIGYPPIYRAMAYYNELTAIGILLPLNDLYPEHNP